MSGAPTSSTERSAARAVLRVGGAVRPSSPRALAAGGCRESGRSRRFTPTYSPSGTLSATAILIRSRSGQDQFSRRGGDVVAAVTSGKPGPLIGAKAAVARAAPAGMCRLSGPWARSDRSGWRTGTRT
jgi:hypothetical protein